MSHRKTQALIDRVPSERLRLLVFGCHAFAVNVVAGDEEQKLAESRFHAKVTLSTCTI